MRSTFTVEIRSDLPLASAIVWERVSTMEGVNRELMPLVWMTAPARLRQVVFTDAAFQQAGTVFVSWLLLFGFLPYDRQAIHFDAVWDGGFSENSYSLMHRVWKHERQIIANGTICAVQDKVHFEPRLPFMGYLLLPIIRRVFQHRHARLRQWAASLA